MREPSPARSTTRRRAVVALTVALLGVVAACGQDAAVSSGGGATATAAPDPGSTPAEPDLTTSIGSTVATAGDASVGTTVPGTPAPPGTTSTGEVTTDPVVAWNRWKAAAPSRYTMRLSSTMQANPVDVTVEGTGLTATAVSAVDATTGEPVDPAPYQTIDRIYDVAIGEFRGCPCLTVVLAEDAPVDGVFTRLTVTDNSGSWKAMEFTITDFAVG